MGMEATLGIHVKSHTTGPLAEIVNGVKTGIGGKNRRNEFLAVDATIVFCAKDGRTLKLVIIGTGRRFQFHPEHPARPHFSARLHRPEKSGFPFVTIARGAPFAINVTVDTDGIVGGNLTTATAAMIVMIVIAGLAVGIARFGTDGIIVVNLTIARFAMAEVFVVAVTTVIVARIATIGAVLANLTTARFALDVVIVIARFAVVIARIVSLGVTVKDVIAAIFALDDTIVTVGRAVNFVRGVKLNFFPTIGTSDFFGSHYVAP